ncbi:MAG: DUF2281 domain-containing protein [Desulfobacteraceae bacterium]|nr:DUF2281 domain-containing protein [Desulfobacteraceae bacterium]
MDIAEKIYKEASRLPEHLAKEVLDFIEYIEKKHRFQEKEIQNLKEAQIPVMHHIWDNEEDGVWDEC